MPEISLAPIDEDRLEELLRVAEAEAAPDEVMGPVPGSPGWTAHRRGVFRDIHRSRREDTSYPSGFDGPHQEVTLAVLRDGAVIGSLRLERFGTGVEAGLWISQLHRGQGVGTTVLGLAAAEAARRGFLSIFAMTTAENAGALTSLRRQGFVIEDPDDTGVIRAVRCLG